MEPGTIVSMESARRQRPQQRVPVPASIFAGRPAPPFVLFDAKGQIAAPEALRTVFVSPADLAALDAYVRVQLRVLRADPAIARADQGWLLRRVLLDEARRALALRDDYEARGLSAVTAQVAAFALEERGGLGLLSGEGGAVGRAVSRALCAVALAAANGLSDATGLGNLAIAAVYADSGNQPLPPEVLSREREPNAEQQRLLLGHPERSVALARRAGVRSELGERAILGHHERWDGGGYPRALRGSQSAIEGRILALADAFAIASPAGDQAGGRDAYEVLRAMTADRGRFDPQLLRRFVPLVGVAIGQQRRAVRAQ